MSAGIEFVCYTSNALLLARALSSRSLSGCLLLLPWGLSCGEKKARLEVYVPRVSLGASCLCGNQFWMLCLDAGSLFPCLDATSLGRKIDAASGRAAFL